ncbi:hypothetical protein [Erythrobacter sp. JK5]|uniref:hypothetical protein n=1 Tax=Erythrobacter sp. JK5 TaxID=2829500 RepID=UPI001BA4A256|nr:hypothetical protein [Erythrobacter sp. JK5]QUL38921.1 hypothetical protein KDC96_06095 [Erythrobacter sp. JK5]
MSQLRQSLQTASKPGLLSGSSTYLAGLRRRLPYYAAAALLAVLALAWIDGGEEPIHPIVQPLEVQGNS